MVSNNHFRIVSGHVYLPHILQSREMRMGCLHGNENCYTVFRWDLFSSKRDSNCSMLISILLDLEVVKGIFSL
ncbi:Uncharacterized protein TCM_033851 [Theobroma cacao]|uniref:Uncharacterized protein n=1 Tax=Theobroma cacao TaxID=3641 RepID=A0A061FC51_THECC|nr:Uncharacterized protein TCM_033851 [Theobroma cacao]